MQNIARHIERETDKYIRGDARKFVQKRANVVKVLSGALVGFKYSRLQGLPTLVGDVVYICTTLA